MKSLQLLQRTTSMVVTSSAYRLATNQSDRIWGTRRSGGNFRGNTDVPATEQYHPLQRHFSSRSSSSLKNRVVGSRFSAPFLLPKNSGLAAASISTVADSAPNASSPTPSSIPSSSSIRGVGTSNTTSTSSNPLGLISLMFSVSHTPGSLQRVLQIFWDKGFNMTRLESRPSPRGKDFDFLVSIEGSANDPRVFQLLHALNASQSCTNVHLLDPARVPWFPTRAQDIDEFANEILDAGADLECDHPGFNDKEYRRRREQLADIARNHRYGDPFPRIEYTEAETSTWTAVWQKLYPLVLKYGCKEHVNVMPDFIKFCGYREDNIPQTADISDYLRAKTGFVLRPVAGLLSARHFLYGLAFRMFFSTQYIRHHSRPLYTPEPDIVHELMGHAPLFADPDFADFSQTIGLAAIGATDEQIEQLARCYWFSVEFGLCLQDGERKAYGAGLLSSFGELEYSMSDKPEIRDWDPFNAAQQTYPITTYQPIYYIAKSFQDAKDKMMQFSQSLARPVNVRFNEFTQSLEVDRNVDISPPPRKKVKSVSYSNSS